MKLLNLGCGNIFHKDWVNIDFTEKENVIKHNLLQGIPCNKNEFDVVYHSHILEHFSKHDAIDFINECYRVLKTNGIIRIVLPDLEDIDKTYLEQLAIVRTDPSKSNVLNYNWILLEMYDQVIRNYPGGEMKEYLQKRHEINNDYLVERIGLEARKIIYSENNSITEIKKKRTIKSYITGFARRIINLFTVKNKIIQLLFKKQINYYNIGKFRQGGEIHQWMYDSYSLKTLLESCGFKDVVVKTAFDSSIPNWNSYNLDSKDGIVYAPKSLFIEARKYE